MESRIVEAALHCFAQYGVSKTTMEDVAQAAGRSRATLYRYFPNKQALLAGVVEAEVRRIGARMDAVAAGAETLDDLVAGLFLEVGRQFEAHDALRHVFAVEPEAVLPHLAFDRGNGVLAVASGLLAPHLARFLPRDAVRRTGEWLCRTVLSYLLSPSEHASLTDEASVRRLVRTFVLPGMPTDAAVPTA